MTDTVSASDQTRPRQIDFRGVAPLRFAETRRRIKAIRSYLGIAAPTDDDRVAAAASIGIGVQQFMSLVRAWAVHGEAVAIAKAGANAGSPRAARRGGLPQASRDAAEGALLALPPSATHKDAIAAVHAACRRRRTRVPSDSMVSYLRMNLRRSGETADGERGLLIGRATAALPTVTNGNLSLPEVALAIDGRSGTIVAAGIVDGATGRPSASFTAAVLKAAGRTTGVVTVGYDDAAIAASIPNARTVSRFTAGRQLARVLGRKLGVVRLAYGPLASTDPRRALRAKADEPLDPSETADVLANAVADHNAARGDGSVE